MRGRAEFHWVLEWHPPRSFVVLFCSVLSGCFTMADLGEPKVVAASGGMAVDADAMSSDVQPADMVPPQDPMVAPSGTAVPAAGGLDPSDMDMPDMGTVRLVGEGGGGTGEGLPGVGEETVPDGALSELCGGAGAGGPVGGAGGCARHGTENWR